MTQVEKNQHVVRAFMSSNLSLHRSRYSSVTRLACATRAPAALRW